MMITMMMTRSSSDSVVKVMDLHPVQWAQVQLPLVSTWVIGGDRKSIQPKLLLCTTEKSYLNLGASVRALEQESQRC